MRPCEATTERKLLALAADNFPHDPKRWSILVSADHVSLHPPGGGTWIEIPSKDFKDIAEWYLAEQKPVKE